MAPKDPTPPAQFGRAELNLKGAARTRSARPNCDESSGALIYKHDTPAGVIRKEP